MITFNNIIIDETIPHIQFACDLQACKGACCTLKGGKGAPLLDSELQEIEKAYPIVRSYLPPEHIETIEENGLYEGWEGNYTTMCRNDRDCVFVFYEGTIAKCAFERAFFDGKISWRKPISCHLFPIRVDRGITLRLRYERIAECDEALKYGNKENIFLVHFLKEPLIRLLGEEWYKKFETFCTTVRQSQELSKRQVV